MKKEYTLRTVTKTGNVVEENKIVLEEGSTLIQMVPEGVSIENASHMHKHLTNALKQGSDLITIPHGIKLQVLEVK